jgi:hypothetical protein
MFLKSLKQTPPNIYFKTVKHFFVQLGRHCWLTSSLSLLYEIIDNNNWRKRNYYW